MGPVVTEGQENETQKRDELSKRYRVDRTVRQGTFLGTVVYPVAAASTSRRLRQRSDAADNSQPESARSLSDVTSTGAGRHGRHDESKPGKEYDG